jgi:hypothetical protein
MITYVPFLKAKGNEINAVGELAPDVREAICPFFDYPRKPGLDGIRFEAAVDKMVRSLEKHLGLEGEFYFDNYDLPEALTVGTKHNYEFLLERLSSFRVIPVVSVDRSPAHVGAVARLRAAGKIHSNTVAFRITSEDFEEYSVIQPDIASDLGPVFAAFDSIDLIFDCQVCTQMEPSSTAAQIQRFSQAFCTAYNVRRVILTGSSIPASAGDILRVQAVRVISRRELEIFRATKAIHAHADLTCGDYCTVSPLYFDLNLAPQILQNVMTAKLTYTLNDSHYFIRGAGLKTKGRGQYFGMAKTLCSQSFFRGATYSSGDAYFYEKSRGLGSNCGPNTVIKPAVNAHISYMVLSGVV